MAQAAPNKTEFKFDETEETFRKGIEQAQQHLQLAQIVEAKNILDTLLEFKNKSKNIALHHLYDAACASLHGSRMQLDLSYSSMLKVKAESPQMIYPSLAFLMRTCGETDKCLKYLTLALDQPIEIGKDYDALANLRFPRQMLNHAAHVYAYAGHFDEALRLNKLVREKEPSSDIFEQDAAIILLLQAKHQKSALPKGVSDIFRSVIAERRKKPPVTALCRALMNLSDCLLYESHPSHLAEIRECLTESRIILDRLLEGKHYPDTHTELGRLTFIQAKLALAESNGDLANELLIKALETYYRPLIQNIETMNESLAAEDRIHYYPPEYRELVLLCQTRKLSPMTTGTTSFFNHTQSGSSSGSTPSADFKYR